MDNGDSEKSAGPAGNFKIGDEIKKFFEGGERAKKVLDDLGVLAPIVPKIPEEREKELEVRGPVKFGLTTRNLLNISNLLAGSFRSEDEESYRHSDKETTGVSRAFLARQAKRHNKKIRFLQGKILEEIQLRAWVSSAGPKP